MYSFRALARRSVPLLDVPTHSTDAQCCPSADLNNNKSVIPSPSSPSTSRRATTTSPRDDQLTPTVPDLANIASKVSSSPAPMEEESDDFLKDFGPVNTDAGGGLEHDFYEGGGEGFGDVDEDDELRTLASG